MDSLRVRMYNVRFGDAILVSVPDAENGVPTMRYILIDVGNALSKEGGRDFVFKPVIEDIRAMIGDASIDLYIMTHEHLDHIQGLFYGEVKESLPRLPVKSAWLPASSEPGYYDRDWPDTDQDGNPLGTPKKHLDRLKLTIGLSRVTQKREKMQEKRFLQRCRRCYSTIIPVAVSSVWNIYAVYRRKNRFI